MGTSKETLRIKAVGKYYGHSFKQNGAVELKLKFGYEELPNYYMKLPFLRSENTTIVSKVEDGAAMELGTFMLKSYSMDHDGEGTVTFSSLYDHVEPENLNELVANKDKLVKIMFKADIEVEQDEEEDE
jgi:hypothetical protein